MTNLIQRGGSFGRRLSQEIIFVAVALVSIVALATSTTAAAAAPPMATGGVEFETFGTVSISFVAQGTPHLRAGSWNIGALPRASTRTRSAPSRATCKQEIELTFLAFLNARSFPVRPK